MQQQCLLCLNQQISHVPQFCREDPQKYEKYFNSLVCMGSVKERGNQFKEYAGVWYKTATNTAHDSAQVAHQIVFDSSFKFTKADGQRSICLFRWCLSKKFCKMATSSLTCDDSLPLSCSGNDIFSVLMHRSTLIVLMPFLPYFYFLCKTRCFVQYIIKSNYFTLISE